MKKLISTILMTSIISASCGTDTELKSELNGVRGHFNSGTMGLQEFSSPEGDHYFRMLVCKKLKPGTRITFEMKMDNEVCQNPFLTDKGEEVFFKSVPKASEGGTTDSRRSAFEIISASVVAGTAIGAAAGSAVPVVGNIVLGAVGAAGGFVVGVIMTPLGHVTEGIFGRDKRVAKSQWNAIFSPISNKSADGKVNIKAAVNVVAKEIGVKVNKNVFKLNK